MQHEHTRPWHQDWLWRLADPWRGAPKKNRWVGEGRNARIRGGLIHVDGSRTRPARNYILFEPEDGARTAILADPPTIAHAARGAQVERWTDGALAQDLRQVILTPAGRDTLRTTNPQQPHRHLKLAASAATVREHLMAIQAQHELALRRPI